MTQSTLSHDEIGDQWIAKYGSQVMYSRSKFWRFEEGLWVPLPQIERELWLTAVGLEKVRATKSLVSSVKAYLSSVLWVDEKQLDGNPDLINMQNGTLSLSTGEFREHRAADHLTTMLGFAHDDAAQCPRWKQFLAEVLVTADGEPDAGLILFMQEAFGYSLTIGVEHEMSFWLVGEGANGKSTLLHVLELLAGNSAIHLNLGVLAKSGGEYQLADLGGKRVVVCAEAPETTVADATLKQIVSGDPMMVRPPYGFPFVIRPIAKVWWAMNTPPKVSDSSEGFWRKLAVLPFNRSFDIDERDRQLRGKLAGELAGIFNWSLSGLHRLRERGHFSEAEASVSATEQFRTESDPVGTYLSECILTTFGTSTSSAVLYQTYREWCKASGVMPLSSTRFGRELRRKGFKPTRQHGQRVWQGLELIDDSLVREFVTAAQGRHDSR